MASAELGTHSSWLLGRPSAWSGDASPSNAASDTDLISPDDTTSPCSETPSSILAGSEPTFCTVQSSSDMDDVPDRCLSARATVSNVDLPPVHRNVCGRSHAHETLRTSGHFHSPPPPPPIVCPCTASSCRCRSSCWCRSSCRCRTSCRCRSPCRCTASSFICCWPPVCRSTASTTADVTNNCILPAQYQIPSSVKIIIIIRGNDSPKQCIEKEREMIKKCNMSIVHVSLQMYTILVGYISSRWSLFGP